MSVGPCENYPSQVVWVLRKHIHSSNKHKNWLSASIVRFFPPYWIPTLRRCCHAWLQNIHVRHFNPYRIQRVCSQSRRKQTADPLSTRHPNLLQILAHYASFVAGSPSTKQSQQLPIIGLCECIIFFNLSPPDITCHHLERAIAESDKARRKPTESHSHSKEEKSPYLCFAAIPPILFSRLGEICKYPCIKPARNLRVCVSFLFFLSRAVRRPERRFSFPPLSFKTDVNGPGRVAPPASLLSSQPRGSKCNSWFFFSNENSYIDMYRWGFYCGGPVAVFLLDASGCLWVLWRISTCIHSNRRHSGISSSSGGTALRRPPTETRPTPAGESYFTLAGKAKGDGRSARSWQTVNIVGIYKWSGQRWKWMHLLKIIQRSKNITSWSV